MTTPNLDRVVTLMRRRMRLDRGLAVAGPAAVAGSGGLVLWWLVGRFVILPPIDTTLVPAVAGAAVVVVLAVAARGVPSLRAAWTADRVLKTHDAFSTAVETLQGTVEPPVGLARQQVETAEAQAAEVRELPDGPRVPSRAFGVAGVLAGVALLLAFAPNPQDAERERRIAEAAAVDAVAEELEDHAEELGDEPAADRLRQVAEQLGETRPEALTAVEQARAALAAELPEDLASRRTALAGLAAELEARPLAAGDGAAEQLASLAQDVGAGALDAAAQAGLAERLDALGDALTGQPEIAAAMDEAAQALRAGDVAAADALTAAAAATRSAQAAAAAASAAERASGALAAAADDLRAGESAQGQGNGQSSSQGQGAGSGEGSGQGQGSGQGSGQGRGTGQGQGGGGGGGQGQGSGQGGGSGMGATGSPQQGTGSGAGSTGGGEGSTAGSALDEEPVFAPRRDAPGAGDELRLEGTPDPTQPEIEAGRALGPGLFNDALVPYRDVLPTYLQRATRTVQQPGYPVRLRDTITDYFDRLADPDHQETP